MGFSMQMFGLSIKKNGVVFDEDDDGNEIQFPAGSNIYESLEFLSKPENLNIGLEGYTMFSVNGVSVKMDALKQMKLTEDTVIEFINKSDGGSN